MFLKAERLEAARAGMLADDRRWVSDLADALKDQGLSVRYDVRWDHPRAAAILRKVDEAHFDWVLKDPANDRFGLGLFSNTDWDLLRDCPVPVYFVKGSNSPYSGVLVALEGCAAVTGSEEAVLDYDVYRHGRRIAEGFDAAMTVVHAFQVPSYLPAYIGYVPIVPDTRIAPEAIDSLIEVERQERRRVAERHGRAIQAFADYFSYPVDDIVIREGAPDIVISDEAHRRQSGLVVIGAAEASRLDRLFRKVTAEPTLAEADCDILFVKPVPALPPPSALGDVPVSVSGTRSDSDDSNELTEILMDPSLAFEAPRAVIHDDRFSAYEKRRILRAWEHDMLQLMVADDEGILGPETPELDAVRDALRLLRPTKT